MEENISNQLDTTTESDIHTQQIETIDSQIATEIENVDWSVDRIQSLLSTGGPVAIVLIVLSVVVLALTLLKLWHFYWVQLDARKFISSALENWRSNQSSNALEILNASRSPIARVMESAINILNDRKLDSDMAREEVLRVASIHLDAVRSHLKSLEVIAALSPLLGLLGTVFGMIEAFKRLENAGTAVDPAILSGGIWEALITTAMGLSVAIPAIFILNCLERRVSRFQLTMEDAMTQVFIIDAMNSKVSDENSSKTMKVITDSDFSMSDIK